MRPFLFEKYEGEDNENKGKSPCGYCGKGTNPEENRMVRVFEGGNAFARDEATYYAPDDDIEEDLGFYRVHKECASRLRKRRVYIGPDLTKTLFGRSA